MNNSQKRRNKKRGHGGIPAHQNPKTWAEADAMAAQLAQQTPQEREQWIVDDLVSLAREYARDAAATYAPDGRLHADKAVQLYEIFLEGFRLHAPAGDAALLDRVLGKARAQLGLPKEAH